MADFGYFSDTDDSAVEELVSQANELSALEQIAAINCSSFNDSTLPDDLEARFRRLKSLPSSKPDPVSSSPSKPDPVSSSSSKPDSVSSSSKITHQKKHFSHSKSVAVSYSKKNRQNPGNKSGSVCLSDEETSVLSGNKLDLGFKSGLEKDRSGDFTPVKKTQKLTKRRTGPSSSSSSSSPIDLASPPSSDSEPEKKPKPKPKSKWFDKFVGYIWSSPKKSLTKEKKNLKSFNESSRERNIDDFDEFLSDLNAYSMEDQRKMLKKALKEQQKMRKEAAEIIKMAKQASAKFDFDD